jgi:NAD(P)-dependent dehydrogenase (short-subunit alcohol dehydrogenase family)
MAQPVSGALDGRVMVVTGGGNGVGRGVALAGAAAGARVVVASPRDNGAETVALIEARGGVASWCACDVTRRADVDATVATAVERFGGLDAVVHNATSRHSSEVVALEDVTQDVFDDHIAVSLRAAYYCALAARPHLRAGRGRYILFTSPAGMTGSPTLPLYSAVKGALRSFTKSLALEWAPDGINVTCISPLAVTPALANAYVEDPAMEDRLRRIVPLGRIGDPEADIGPAAVFLASDAARYITGQTLIVDGGRFTGL